MKRLLVAAALVLSAPPAAAQTTAPSPANPTVVLTSVDAVSVESSRVVVTGVVQGDTAPTQWYLQQYTTEPGTFAANCQRAALLAMAKPGQYLLELRTSTSYASAVCKLTRVAP